MISRPETSGPAASPRAVPRRSAVAGLALAALVLAGCGGGSSLVADGTTVAPAGTVPVGASPDTGVAGSSPDPAAAAGAARTPAPGPAAPADRPAAAPTPPGAPAPPPTSGPNGALPSLPVYDVATGAKVDLARVPPPDRPMLVWFWAPH